MKIKTIDYHGRNGLMICPVCWKRKTNLKENEVISERDDLINGASKEQFKGDYRTINADVIQAKTNENFITIGTQNYERVNGDFFAKLTKNESDSYTINNEQPSLSINVEDYTSIQSEAKIEQNNKYSKEEGEKLGEC